jgi:hypothetical protein
LAARAEVDSTLIPLAALALQAAIATTIKLAAKAHAATTR